MCMTVEKQVEAMEEEIMVNPQYVQKVLRPQDEDGAHVQPLFNASQPSTSRPV